METKEKSRRPSYVQDKDEINFESPFIVLRKYQGRMISSRAKKRWRQYEMYKQINDFMSEEISSMYSQ